MLHLHQLLFNDRSSNPGLGSEFHKDKHYTLVPSVNPTCHPSEVGKWVPVKLLGSNCGNTREWSGTLPYHLVEAIEKGAFGFGFIKQQQNLDSDWIST